MLKVSIFPECKIAKLKPIPKPWTYFTSSSDAQNYWEYIINYKTMLKKMTYSTNTSQLLEQMFLLIWVWHDRLLNRHRLGSAHLQKAFDMLDHKILLEKMTSWFWNTSNYMLWILYIKYNILCFWGWCFLGNWKLKLWCRSGVYFGITVAFNIY